MGCKDSEYHANDSVSWRTVTRRWISVYTGLTAMTHKHGSVLKQKPATTQANRQNSNCSNAKPSVCG